MTPANSPAEIKDINYSVNGLTYRVRALMQMVRPVDLSTCKVCPAFNRSCDGPSKVPQNKGYAEVNTSNEAQTSIPIDSLPDKPECESPIRSAIKVLSKRLGEFMAVFKPTAGIDRQAAQTITLLANSFGAVFDYGSQNGNIVDSAQTKTTHFLV